MATCTDGQFASNMLRRTIFVLQLCGLLAACGCTVLRGSAYGGVPSRDRSIVDPCGRENSTECGAEKLQRLGEVEREKEMGDRKGQTRVRVARMIGEEDLGRFRENQELEVSARRKKGKGYGQMLLYFLGASKLTMLYVLINTVAAIAGKALIVAKVALAIATAIAIKKASEHKEKVSYEIIKHPYHSYENTHSSSVDYDIHNGFGENDFNYRKRRRIYH